MLVDVRSVAEFRELLDGGRSGVHMLLEVMSSVSCKLCQQVRAEFAEVADHMRVDAPDMVVARIDAANLKPIDPQAEEEAHYRTAFDLDGKRHGFPSIYYVRQASAAAAQDATPVRYTGPLDAVSLADFARAAHSDGRAEL